MTDYLVYDVFTDHAFGGNQLAVFQMPAHGEFQKLLSGLLWAF